MGRGRVTFFLLWRAEGMKKYLIEQRATTLAPDETKLARLA